MSKNAYERESKEFVSLWDLSSSEPVFTQELQSDEHTDIAIIGGGFTGLSTALHLAEKGISCHVLEANKIGFGGSGRNCGMVNAGVWLAPQDVKKVLGDEGAERFLNEMGNAPDAVFSLIEKYSIDCEATRNGTIHAAHSPAGYKELSARAEEWHRLGRNVELLDAKKAADKIGTSHFYGGLLDPKAGTINPMAYARGLAKVSIDNGAKINTHSAATKLEKKNDQWLISTANGTLTANKVLLSSNAYSDNLWPGLNQTLTSIYFYQIATEPLGMLADFILPEKQSVWDTGKVMFAVRKDQFGRLILGSMGKLAGKDDQHTKYWAQKQINKMFPQLGNVKFEKAWHGIIGLTNEHLPRINRLDEGLYAPIGFNGRGITTGTVFGKSMAELFTGGPESDLLLPITGLKKDKTAFICEPLYEGCFKAWRYYKSL